MPENFDEFPLDEAWVLAAAAAEATVEQHKKADSCNDCQELQAGARNDCVHDDPLLVTEIDEDFLRCIERLECSSKQGRVDVLSEQLASMAMNAPPLEKVLALEEDHVRLSSARWHTWMEHQETVDSSRLASWVAQNKGHDQYQQLNELAAGSAQQQVFYERKKSGLHCYGRAYAHACGKLTLQRMNRKARQAAMPSDVFEIDFVNAACTIWVDELARLGLAEGYSVLLDYVGHRDERLLQVQQQVPECW
jgi:hypothetical protein